MEENNQSSPGAPTGDRWGLALEESRTYRWQMVHGPVMSAVEGDVGREYIRAMAKAKAALAEAGRNASGTERYRYGSLASILDTLAEPLRANGFEISQPPVVLPGWAGAVTEVAHESGQYRAVTVMLPVTAGRRMEGGKEPAAPTAREYGAAIRHARRYGLLGILGLPSEEVEEVEGFSPTLEVWGADWQDRSVVVTVLKSEIQQGSSGGKAWSCFRLLVREKAGEEYWLTTLESEVANQLLAARTAVVEIEEVRSGGKAYRKLKRVIGSPLGSASACDPAHADFWPDDLAIPDEEPPF